MDVAVVDVGAELQLCAVANKVYISPGLSIKSPCAEKFATPEEELIEVVPPNVPPLGLLLIESEIVHPLDVCTLLLAS